MGRGGKEEGEHKEKLDCEHPPPLLPFLHPSLLHFSPPFFYRCRRRRGGAAAFSRRPPSGLSGGGRPGVFYLYLVGRAESRPQHRPLPPPPPPPLPTARAEHMLRRGRQRRCAGGEALRLTLSGLQQNPVIICQRRGASSSSSSVSTTPPPLPPPHSPRHRCSTVEVVITKRLALLQLPPRRASEQVNERSFRLFLWAFGARRARLDPPSGPWGPPPTIKMLVYRLLQRAIRHWLYRPRDHREKERDAPSCTAFYSGNNALTARLSSRGSPRSDRRYQR